MTQTLPAPTGTPLISDADLKAAQDTSRGEIPHPSLPKGSNLYGSTKIFPDYQAGEGESYFTLVHGIAHESSVSFVACLQALRALRKGFESVLYFYGPAAMNAMATRGFPTTGDSGFPGEQNINTQIERHGTGADRVLFASDQPWGDFAGEHARLLAATGGGELTDLFFRRNFESLHGF